MRLLLGMLDMLYRLGMLDVLWLLLLLLENMLL
jgi:hypothetical protein